MTIEKSENINEAKLINPDWLACCKNIFITGTKEPADKTSITEKIMQCLITKNRFSLLMRFSIFSQSPMGNFIVVFGIFFMFTQRPEGAA